MTFRQILAVLWARKWIVVVIVLFALIGAGGYIMLRTVTYMSEETVRMNTVISGGATSDDVGGGRGQLRRRDDRVPRTCSTPREPPSRNGGSDLVGMVKGSLVDDGHATNVVVSATGATPKIAQQRAAAVVKAYEDHIGKEMARVLEILQKRKDDAIAQAQVLQGQVRADPSNSIAATNLATELSRMSSISTQIDSINNSGAPTSTLIAAQPGTPTVPSALVVVLLALSTGLIVGIAAALIRDQFDNRIRDEEDVEALLDVPVIGSLTWDRDVSRMAVPLPSRAMTAPTWVRGGCAPCARPCRCSSHPGGEHLSSPAWNPATGSRSRRPTSRWPGPARASASSSSAATCAGRTCRSTSARTPMERGGSRRS